VIPYTIHPKAEAEIEAAAIVYESQRSGLSISFIAAV
jgi:hypothetical protein